MPTQSDSKPESSQGPAAPGPRPSSRPLIETIVRFDPETKTAAVVEVASVDRGPVKLQDLPVVREFGGRQDGLEPTRYGDWEKNGRCIDF